MELRLAVVLAWACGAGVCLRVFCDSASWALVLGWEDVRFYGLGSGTARMGAVYKLRLVAIDRDAESIQ
jgi:hypothetical protein